MMSLARRLRFLALTLILASSPAHFAEAATGDCGQPVSGGASPLASDCLFILNAAVGLQTCNPECICDVDGSGSTSATDALRCLAKAVGQPVMLECPCATTTTTTTTTIPGGGGQPELVAGDFPGVSPCADRDTLPENATFRGVIAATGEYNIVVNFTRFDQDGFPEICGLAAADNNLPGGAIPWDPGTALPPFRGCSVLSDDLRDFFTMVPISHGPEFCQTGNSGSTDAMPRAGIYRKDSCIESGGNAYDVRTRGTISGASVDQTFTALGITRSQLRVCNGTTELRTGSEVRSFLTANPRSRSFSIKSGTCSGTNHLDVAMEIVCVKLRSQPCPQHDFGACPF